jgi:hypothetical protein
MSARQNHITVRIRYSRSQQTITYRGVGVFGRINMSTLSVKMPPAAITGGTTRGLYWSAILSAVASDLVVRF